MTLQSVLAWMVILVSMPLNWVVVFELWRLSRSRPYNLILRDRLVVAMFLSEVVTVFALVFVNNDLDSPLVEFESTKVFTRFSILSLSIPALYWLSLYRRKR